MTQVDRLTFGEQFRLLIRFQTDAHGQPHSMTKVAEATGISVQTLLNLLDGTAGSPRYDNARRLCRFYGITLDYFDCETEAACRDYLAQHRIDAATPETHTIEEESQALSPRGKRNILAFIEWVRRGKTK